MYPVNLDIEGRWCAVVGGGRVAERKVEGLLAAGARVRVISPALAPGLQQLAAAGQISWLEKEFSADDLEGAFLVFAATNDRTVQEAVGAAAQSKGLLVNVADSPSGSTFHVPAVVRRGALTLAVATEGQSPAVAAMVRQRLAEQFGEEYRLLLELAGSLRRAILHHPDRRYQTPEARKILFKKFFDDDIVTWIRKGRWDLVDKHVRTVFGPDTVCDFSRLEQSR